MSEKINSDLIRGSVNTIVLRSLFESDRYGYEIIKYVEEQTNGQYVLKQPTLYSSLRRLENMGFVSFYWGEETHGGRRKYYTLTELGRSVFEKNQNEYRFSREMIDKLITENGDKREEKTVDDQSENTDQTVVAGDETPADKEEPVALSDQNTDKSDYRTVDAVPDVEVPVAPSEIKDSEVVNVDETPHTDSTDDKAEKRPESIDTETNEVYHSEMKTEEISGAEKFREMFAELQKNGYAQKAAEETPTTPRSDRNETEYISPSPQNAEATAYSLDSTDYRTSYDANSTFRSYAVPDLHPYEKHDGESEPNKSSDSFYSYDTPTPELASDVNSGYDDYKSKLSSIFDPNRTEQPTTPDRENAATVDKADDNAISIKEKIMVRSFGKITENVKQLGENVKIRTPDVKAAKEYNEQFYYYRNKLLLYKYGALFLLMAVEILLTFVIVRGFLKIRTDNDVALYVTCVLVALAFPVVAAALYLNDPKKRKRLEFNLKTSLIFRIIIMLQIALIVYALNVYFGMPIGGSSDYALSIALPVVMSTNVPVAAIIFNGLYKSKKFAVK